MILNTIEVRVKGLLMYIHIHIFRIPAKEEKDKLPIRGAYVSGKDYKGKMTMGNEGIKRSLALVI